MLGLMSDLSICPPTLHLSLPAYEVGWQDWRGCSPRGWSQPTHYYGVSMALRFVEGCV